MRLTLQFHAKTGIIDEAILQSVPTAAIQPILRATNPLEEYILCVKKNFGMDVYLEQLIEECSEHKKSKHRLVWGYAQ